MIANRDESAFGKMVEHLLVVDPKFYVQILKKPAAEPGTGSIKIVVMNPVDLVDVEQFHRPLNKATLTFQSGHHFDDIIIIKHGPLHCGGFGRFHTHILYRRQQYGD